MARAQPRKPCLGILIGAAAGIGCSELFACNLALAGVAAGCFAVAAFSGRRVLPFWLLVATVFMVRHELDWRRGPGRFPIELLNQGVSVAQATGIVTSDPMAAGYSFHSEHSHFEAAITRVDFKGRSYAVRFPAEVYWTGNPPVWGDEFRLTASIAPISHARNPGEFDYARYLARKGLFAEFSTGYASDNTILAHGKGGPLPAWARRARAFLERRLTLGIDDDQEIAGLIQTITMGDKQESSVEMRDLFQRVGALHLFVVNGLHVALLAGILALLLKPIGIQRRLFALVIIPTLFGYALLTGLSPGSVRAAIMAAVIFGASFVERRPFSFNTLAAAAVILLLWDTDDLFQEGFQFSFGVVTAILLLAKWIRKPILPLGLPDPFIPRLLWTRWQRVRDGVWRRFADVAAVSVAASVGSFPFSAGYSNLAAPSGFLANLFLVPIAFGILAEAIFSILASWAGSLPVLFNNVNWALGSMMLGVVHGFALMPGGHFFVSTSSVAPPECRITVLDLGQGQAVVVESKGKVWLVDCGNTSSYSRIVRPFLEVRGVNRLDGLILTHGAAPAIGAAQQVVAESTATDRSPARRALQAALAQAGIPKTLVESGDELQFSSGTECSVLFPPAGFEGRTAADKSLILRIADDGGSVLLMSDSGFTGERWLMEHALGTRASVVVIGGQAEDISGTGGFIGSVRPFAVVRGEPGFGASKTGDMYWSGAMRGEGVTPFAQSEAGAVVISLNQSHITVSGFADGQFLDKRLDGK